MEGFEGFVSMLYADGDVFMMICNIVIFIFVLECAAYFVSMIAAISKGVLK